MIFIMPLAMTMVPDMAVNTQTKHTIASPDSIAVILSVGSSGQRIGEERQFGLHRVARAERGKKQIYLGILYSSTLPYRV
jgi:hypothetical protein